MWICSNPIEMILKYFLLLHFPNSTKGFKLLFFKRNRKKRRQEAKKDGLSERERE